MQQIVAKQKIGTSSSDIYIAPKCYCNIAMSRDNTSVYTLQHALDWPLMQIYSWAHYNTNSW